ncbi:hypothetical protein [uncultured Thiodictyon sp.]|nr:hypothetical protein [uncultured Thiodictyon sp.]
MARTVSWLPAPPTSPTQRLRVLNHPSDDLERPVANVPGMTVDHGA